MNGSRRRKDFQRQGLIQLGTINSTDFGSSFQKRVLRGKFCRANRFSSSSISQCFRCIFKERNKPIILTFLLLLDLVDYCCYENIHNSHYSSLNPFFSYLTFGHFLNKPILADHSLIVQCSLRPLLSSILYVLVHFHCPLLLF